MPSLPENLLLCPVCGSSLHVEGRGLACVRGHRFDAARQGYVNLLTGRGTAFEADNAGMVEARARFLAAGHYSPLRDAVAAAAQRHVPDPRVVVDAGAGTGYYLRGVTDRFPGTLPVALDISKFALRKAARELPGGIALVWDLWRPLPLSSGSADLLLNVFAPRNVDEFVRVLSPGGLLVVATPLPGHLGEAARLVPMLEVPADKAQDLAGSLDGRLTEVERREVVHEMRLSPEELADVAAMGPAARHLEPRQLAALVEGLDREVPVTARFTVQAFRHS
ncbi:putative RNA methyltransferase [Arthrobacter sp. TMN-37]